MLIFDSNITINLETICGIIVGTIELFNFLLFVYFPVESLITDFFHGITLNYDDVKRKVIFTCVYLSAITIGNTILNRFILQGQTQFVKITDSILVISITLTIIKIVTAFIHSLIKLTLE